MTPPAAVTVASRLLEPLAHPWASVAAAVLPSGPGVLDALGFTVHVAFRLLHLLLAL